MYSTEAFATAFAIFEVGWLLAVPLWQSGQWKARAVALGAAAWMIAVALVAWRGYFRISWNAVPAMEVVSLVGVFLAVLSSRLVGGVVNARTLMALQVFRGLVGAAFLSLASQSKMAPTVGYGVGLLEVLLALAALGILLRRPGWSFYWNAAALVEWLAVVALFAVSVPGPVQVVAEGALLARIADFPFALVPAFLWPVGLMANIGFFRAHTVNPKALVRGG